MDALFGKGCRVVLCALLLGCVVFGAGCNFFGKELAATPLPTGQLPGGASILGTWSASFSDTSTSNVPKVATTETFVFDGTGTAHIQVQGHLVGQGTCTGDGPYRLDASNNIVIFVQSGTCQLPPQITFVSPSVNPTYLSYTDPLSHTPAKLFTDHAQNQAPVGVWSFGGQSGIDYLFFDQHGYFLMQTTLSGSQYLLQGYYGIGNGQLVLTYFNGDPTQLVGQMVFSSFITNGQQLQLTQTTSQGNVVVTGTLQ